MTTTPQTVANARRYTATSTELIVSVAAKALAGKRSVFAGVGLPTLAVDLAQRTVNPDVELVYESGVCGAHPTSMPESIGDAVIVAGAEAVLPMQALFGYVLQGGHIDVGFLGAAQIDRFGSLNTSFIGDARSPRVRLPGAGGAPEIMMNAAEVFVIMRRHDHGSFPQELDFCTSPSPVRGRESGLGLPHTGMGVSTVITPLGTLERATAFSELELVSVHEGVSVDQVRAATGWDLKVSDGVHVTTPPSDESIRLLRGEIDTVRLYLR